jgi:hypothetical protein
VSAAAAEYPQIRTMFADALKAMAEGETEAEKQIVYVLNEARAALPCPSFVASGISGSRHLFVMLGGKIVSVVQVSAVAGPGFMVVSPCSDAFGAWTTEPDVLSLASDVGRALKAAHWVIMQAAAEAVPKVRTDYSAGLVTRAEAVQMFSGGFAGASPVPSAPENDPKALRAAMSRAFEEIRGMRKEFRNPDSDYGAGAKEACDRIAAALVIAE